MRAGNPIESIAESLYSAIYKDLPDISYMHQSPQDRKEGREGTQKHRRPRTDEVEVVHFPQLWSSTALGFGGIGGQAMTTAYTTIVSCEGIACVYFNGGFAYMAEHNAELQNAISNQKILEVSRATSAYKVIKTFRQ